MSFGRSANHRLIRFISTVRRISPRRIGFALVTLAALNLSLRPIGAANYEYPYRDPYLATATSAILSDNGATRPVDSTILHVPGLAGRNNLPSLEGRGEVSLAWYRQNRSTAPLLFILAGLGSNPYFGVAPYLASLFYREGFHVVVLPSPMSWNFALAASRSGAPGYVAADARDLYEVMQRTLTTLRHRFAIAPTSINFMAVSLGALEGAHLSVVDADERKIGIARFLLVNPPLDLAYAIDKIDTWNNLGTKFGRAKAQEIIARALAVVDSFADERRDDPAVFDRLAKKFSGFSDEELQFLIAENLQSELSELVYVTQVIHEQKVLSAPRDDMRQRLEEAKRFSFTDYHQKIALPLWQKQIGDPQADVDTFIRRDSLMNLIDRLRDNPKVHILHNADDFLAPRRANEELKQALGDQVTLYPHGGHLGNLWFPANKDFFVKYFRPTSNEGGRKDVGGLSADRFGHQPHH